MDASSTEPMDHAGRSATAAAGHRNLTGWRVVASVSAVAVGVLLFGFLVFAAYATRIPDYGSPNAGGTGFGSAGQTADGIIVLTGGDHRIVEGGRLLRTRVARRMLISGVNPETRRADIVKLSALDGAMFECCVDLGYAARDTVGNAEESRTWVSGIGAKRVIVVTSGYHMPRSLAELSLAMPGIELIPHPVVPKSVGARAWWLQPGLVRLLATEYAKFIPVAARYAAMRQFSKVGSPPDPAMKSSANAAAETR